MNAMVDFLIDEQHAAIDAARPRFAAQMVRETVKARDSRLMPMWDAAYCVRPNLAWATSDGVPHSAYRYETNDHAEAELVAQTMLFCGAETVSIHSYADNRRSETVELWKAAR